MKRGLIYLQLKQSQKALDDFTQLVEIAEQTQQGTLKAYYYKAKALKKLNNLSDSVLYFEQVVRGAD